MKIKIFAVIIIVLLIFFGFASKYVSNKDEVSKPETVIVTAAKQDDAMSINSSPSISASIQTPVPEATINNTEIKIAPAPELNIDKTKGGYANMLEGKVICIDPGHGNPNHPVQYEPIAPNSDILKPATATGTTGVSTKIPEYKLTMAVSLKIRDRLTEKGAKVIMTRENNDVDPGNIERSEMANRIPADISVRIHADGFDDASVEGISVLYPSAKYIRDAELIRKSTAAAQITLEELVKTTKGRSRGIVARDDLTGFNWSKAPVILVEMGFMTNPSEDERLNTDEYQSKIADGIVNGLIRYFGK